jgi:hypothetical protein
MNAPFSLPAESSEDSSSRPVEVAFDYIKSNFFRSARADGVWGGINGHLDVVMAFYSERPSIPQHVVHTIEGNVLGDELPEKRVGRDAIIREVEICVSMDLSVAKVFREWLDTQIKNVEGIKLNPKTHDCL